MKETVNKYRFVEAFDEMNRGNNFTVEGRESLFDYLEEYEESTGQEIELDVIAICCDFNEYESLEEFRKEYGDEYETIEDIEQQTIVIPIDDEAFIIQVF